MMMRSWLARLGRVVLRGNGRTGRRGRVAVESLEGRDCPASITSVYDIYGTLHLSVQGSEQADSVTVTLDQGNLANMFDNQVVVTAKLNGQTFQQTANLFKWSGGLLVAETIQIDFAGLGGNDSFSNQTSLRSEVKGGFGNDLLFGGGGMDTLLGEAGDDILWGGDGNDRLYGDHYTMNAPSWAEAVKVQGCDIVDGAGGDDEIVGGGNEDNLLGGAGNDLIKGGATYAGYTDDHDTIDGGAGNDTIFGCLGNDTIHGGDGNDLVNGSEGDDHVYGDAGFDTVQGGNTREQLGDDYLEGGADDDVVWGMAGNDILYGGSGNDLLMGDLGDDVLHGEAGNDDLWGGWNCYLDTDPGEDRLYGGEGDDFLSGGYGNDSIHGQGGNDSLYGEYFNDGAIGESDRLYGGSGTDYLVGTRGNDTLFGGADGCDDVLDGREGADTLIIEPASPGFAGDEVLFFTPAEGDKIVLWIPLYLF